MKKAGIGLILSCLALVTTLPVYGAIAQYDTQTTYNAAGTILESNDFEMFNNWGAYYPGNPWHISGVTYANTDYGNQTTTMNSIMGMGTNIYPQSRNFHHSYWRDELTAYVDQPPQYNMLSFDLAYAIYNASINTHFEDVDFTVTTNSGSLSSTLNVGSVSFTPTFVGFIADPGEYFTGFTVKGRGTTYGTIDNVTLGQATVPLPPAVLLLFSGLFGLGFFHRKSAKQ